MCNMKENHDHGIFNLHQGISATMQKALLGATKECNHKSFSLKANSNASKMFELLEA